MLIRYFMIGLLFVVLLISCNNNSIETIKGHWNEKQTAINPSKDAVDNNFKNFIQKFSTDTIFQLSRTKFPLKVKWYDIENDRDSLIYKERSDFEMMDFRKKNSMDRYDQWEQKIVTNRNDTSVTIEIRGIDNGIIVDYLFEKVDGKWMLIKIDDTST